MLKNIGSNWALALVQIIVMMQLTPVQVAALGPDANGAWLTIASLSGLLGLLILGVPMASVRFISQHAAAKDLDKVNEAVSACLGICLALGASAWVIGAGLSYFFEHTYLRSPAWQTLGPWWIAEARAAYWISVLQVGLGFAAQLPFGIMDAYHEFPAQNVVKIVGLCLRLALTAGVLRIHPSLILVAVIQLGCMVLEFVVALALVHRRCPGVRFSLSRFDRSRVRPILAFSVFATLLGIGTQLAFRSDALVIGAFADPSQGTLFDVGNKFFPPLTGLVLGIGAVMMPTAARCQAQGTMSELQRVFLKWSKIAYSLSLLVGAYLLVLGPEFVGWWMGPSFAGPSGRIVRVLMVSFLFFLPVRGVALPILMGLGKPVRPALAFLAMGFANLGLSLALVRPFGIFGVALGTAIPCIFFAVVVAVAACRELGISVVDYVGYVVARPSVGALPAVAMLLYLKLSLHAFPPDGGRRALLPLVVGGAGMVLVFVVTSVLFVYRGDANAALPARLEHFLPRLLRRKVQ